ncbi:MAG: hypothetical protein WAU70_04625 [Flavobacteriales bacterium]
MRFLPHEHAAVTAALQAHGVDARSVLFVKRRGRLHIELPGRAGAFVFFRRKSTTLDAQGKWQDRVDYFIGNTKAEGLGCTWDVVLQAFTGWLKGTDGTTGFA